jgi:hypothetical protein
MICETILPQDEESDYWHCIVYISSCWCKHGLDHTFSKSKFNPTNFHQSTPTTGYKNNCSNWRFGHGRIRSCRIPPSQPVNLLSLVENRGVSFSIGGDEGAITLGNYFAKYNKDIIGRSIGNRGPNICSPSFCGGLYLPNDKLNAARSGATSSNLQNQVDYLVQQMPTRQILNSCQY